MIIFTWLQRRRERGNDGGKEEEEGPRKISLQPRKNNHPTLPPHPPLKNGFERGLQEAFEGIGSWIWQTIIIFFFSWGGAANYYYYYYSFLVLSGIATNLVYGSFFVH